jgi:hypothetical protein
MVGFRIRLGGPRPRLAALAAGVLVLVATAISPAPAATAATATPNSGQFYGISCPSAKWCMATGQKDTATGELSLAESWNGKTWSQQPAPTPANTHLIFENAVSCTSRDFCMAVGDDIKPSGKNYAIAEVWNGRSWALQLPPTPSGTPEIELTGVSCTSPAFCVAVGFYQAQEDLSTGRLIEMWDGTTWSIYPLPVPQYNTMSLGYAVSCTSPTWCVATGERMNSSLSFVTAAYVWNGTSWSRAASTPNPAGATGAQGAQLDGVSCTSPSACTAVGFYANAANNAYTIAERWNGASWTLQHSTNTTAIATVLSAVSCRSPAACTAVGHEVITSGVAYFTFAERWDRKAWSTQHTPSLTDTSLSAVSCPTPCQCTAVGTEYGSPQFTVAEIWNGRTWSRQTTPSLGSS